MPTRDDILSVLNWIDENRQTKILASGVDSRLNAIKSVSNFLSAVSKELNSIVVDGRALVVEAITSE